MRRIRTAYLFFFLFLGLFSFVIGLLYQVYLFSLGAIFSVWILSMIHAIADLNKRYVFALFNVTFFTFLLSRLFISPIFGELQSEEGLNFSSPQIINHILFSLYLSLFFLFVGFYMFQDKRIVWFKQKERTKYASDIVKFRKKLFLPFLYVCAVAACCINIEKMLFVLSNSYLSYYTDFSSRLPHFIGFIGSSFNLFFFLYLSTMPSKRELKYPFLVFLLINTLSLGYGQRNGVVLAFCFLIAYLILRNTVNSGGKVWFGKREYIICGIITPFALSFLLAFGYIRNELDYESKNIFDSAISFFQGQGVSVNVIGYAKECEGTYPETNISYTFGPIIQELKHNPVSNFFGLFPFYKSQELEAVYHNNNFGATITYLVDPQRFLGGGGLGSSYIAEAWVDFGYVGIIVVNFVFGILLSQLHKWFRQGGFIAVMGMLMFSGLLYAPRGSVSDCIYPIINFRNAFLLVFIYLILKTFYKNKKKWRRVYRG